MRKQPKRPVEDAKPNRPPRLMTAVRAETKSSIRAAVLSSAEHLFRDLGFDETRVERIAELAGISRKTLFNYFQSKENILIAVLGHVRAHLGREFEESPIPLFRDVRDAAPVQAGQRLQQIAKLRWILGMTARHAGVYDVVGPYQSLFKPAMDAQVRRIAATQALGGIRGDIPAEEITWTYERLRNAVYREWLLSDHKPYEALVDRFVQSMAIFLTGLRSNTDDESKIAHWITTVRAEALLDWTATAPA